MAENINIGNAGKDKNARALELYEAFSDVRGEYVDEMLDDRTAAEIRAANRRKSMRLRSSLAAFAAVIAIVVGISVIPHGKMESSGGSNKAVLNASAQKLSGAVLVGSNSELTLKLSDGSSFEGYVDGKITNAKGETVSTEAGKVSVTLDSTSTWTLTADSYVTEFNGSAANVISNGFTLYVNGTALAGTK